jgi:hypothetical protein
MRLSNSDCNTAEQRDKDQESETLKAMERPRGLEPPPTAWQAVVLPLYYGREKAHREAETFIACEARRDKSAHARLPDVPPGKSARLRTQPWVHLIDFDDSRRLDDRRLFLPLGEACRALPIDINPREFFAVMVINGDLPMTVPAPAIAPES